MTSVIHYNCIVFGFVYANPLAIEFGYTLIGLQVKIID